MFSKFFLRRRPEVRDPLVFDHRRHRNIGPNDMPDTFDLKCRAARMGL